MNDLIKYLVESILVEQDKINKIIFIYAGRFQPPLSHHLATFRWIERKFGKDNCYIATSDKVEFPNSPLNFEEKQNIWAKHGVDSSKVIKTKNPYQAIEILSKYDPKTTAVVYIFGEKDSNRLGIGKNKNNKPSYFQPYNPNVDLFNYTKHGYFLSAPYVSININGKELSGTIARNILSKPMNLFAKKELFKQIFGWYDDIIFNKIIPKFETNSINEQKKNLNEGGHLFGSDKIEQKFILSTVKAYINELSRIFPTKRDILLKYELLGSALKKDGPSGDIDLSYNDLDFYGKDPNWGFDDDVILPLLDKFKKSGINYKNALKKGVQKEIDYYLELLRRRTINFLISDKINKHSELISTKTDKATAESIMTSFVQHNEVGDILNNSVQVDLFIGDQNWLRFANFAADYRRNTSNQELTDVYKNYDNLPYKGEVKGAHRTQLLLSLLAIKNLSFSHHHGIINMNTKETITKDPSKVADILNKLYKFSSPITNKILENYHLLHNFIKKNLNNQLYNAVIDNFLKNRLESQRLDIPSDLIDYWKQNKDRLGLTGKFQTNQQNDLNESGSAGGGRVNRNELDETVEEYFNTVILPIFPSATYKIAGSYNTANKNDFGDIDLILKLEGENKTKVKEKLINHVSKLPDNVIVPFLSKKYKGKKYYNSGEIVTILYPLKNSNKFVQIDNIISLNEEESTFKHEFLKIPGEKQAIILGLIKTVFLEEPAQNIFKRLSLPMQSTLNKNQEYEFNLSSQKLTLRKISYDPILLAQGKYKEIHREELWDSTNWDDVIKLLKDYNINKSNFNDLFNKARSLKNPRSKNRLKGVFTSMLSVKSGETGTQKGEDKLRYINNINNL